jgi:hypothetical protein
MVDKITILLILGIIGVGVAFYFLWAIIENAPYPENAQFYEADSQYLRKLHYKQAQNATRQCKPSPGLFNLTKAVQDQLNKKSNAGFIYGIGFNR